MAPPSASLSAPFFFRHTVYSHALNDFLHKWNALLSRADSISTSLLANPAHEFDPRSPTPSPIPNPAPCLCLIPARIMRTTADLRHFVTTRQRDLQVSLFIC
ncbi:hypothetical protein GUJ93_ZPchr0003g17522 [Zizania palustris]|uniref:Uncharacterized protein n=1 Tax=Zizania palustris TaxID=103762 RepID=A0A8J5S8W0_ZIZPA|nr:hypothetical protein GUJ93_ZPchr0003g17522 [Zizania palustris]